jgi:predicted esterase
VSHNRSLCCWALVAGWLLAGSDVWGQVRVVRPARPIYAIPPPRVPARPVGPGFHARLRVVFPGRFDWAFAVPPGGLAGEAPKEATDYASGRQFYQLYVPRGYNLRQRYPLVLFLSPRDDPNEFKGWEALCDKYGIVYAAPYDAGDGCAPARRVRIALDVFDDVRRRVRLDTDRVYLAGFAGGARAACELAFAVPEAFGGVLACSGGAVPRMEPWVRDRVKERLSVALLAGEVDTDRAALERRFHPLLKDCGVRTRLWVVPRQGHTLPAPAVLEEAYLWLEGAVGERRALPRAYPASRLSDSGVPRPEAWSRALLEEGVARLRDPATQESGLMQLEGVATRWKGTPGARQAERALELYNGGGKRWQDVYARRQQEYAYRRAKAFSAWLEGPLPERDARRKGELIREGIEEWARVARFGEGTKEGREAKERVERLRKELEKEGAGK